MPAVWIIAQSIEKMKVSLRVSERDEVREVENDVIVGRGSSLLGWICIFQSLECMRIYALYINLHRNKLHTRMRTMQFASALNERHATFSTKLIESLSNVFSAARTIFACFFKIPFRSYDNYVHHLHGYNMASS